MTRAETPRLDRLQAALAAADLDAVRSILLELDGEERRLLEQGMGSEAFSRARRAAARGRRRGKLGKVLVLPGIMGSELDSVDSSGASDRIWLNFVNLILGRIVDFALTPEGEPAKAGVQIRPAGVHLPTYVPILMELDSRWQVRPFAFDWREDIDRSAARLDEEIKAFGAGEPVHLVTHSMGGLVARRFVNRFRDTWEAIDDPEGRGRGGRLVMIGTPNRGSFAIPLVLTGGDKIVRALAKGDIEHSLEEVLAIVATFPGMYQLLPSPLSNSMATTMQSSSSGRPGATSRCTSRSSTGRVPSTPISRRSSIRTGSSTLPATTGGRRFSSSWRLRGSSPTARPARETGECRTRSVCSRT